MTPIIHIVGLGPGNPRLVTVDTLDTIAATETRYVRTARHPSAALVPDARTFDHLYDSLDTFDEVYASIADELTRAAREHGTIVYAVPGSPLVLERTVARLRTVDDLDVRLHPAVSFLDEAWRVLHLDPIETGVRLVDGHDFAASAAGVTGPMLVAHTHANWVLSDIKLAIDDPDPDARVVLLHHLGLDDETIVETTWAAMDRALEADHLTSLWIPSLGVPVAAELVRFHELARTLRARCPWDIEQTHTSLVRYLIEETYEVVDAIENLDADDPATDGDFIEELGDLLYQVGFHSAIAEEQGRFTIADVARTVHDKLVARHPHVFGDVVVADAGEVESNWEAIKAKEKPARTGIFDGLASSSPSLLLADKVQQRAARAGFDWPDHDGPLAKVGEEAREVSTAVAAGDPEAVRAEVGDLLFAAVNVARKLGVEPESALRSAVSRFRARVEAVDADARQSGRDTASLTPAELDELWESAKRRGVQ